MPSENLLKIECDVSGEIASLSLMGELIAETRFEPERILREWFEGGVTRVIVRCGELRYIDSAGLSILLGALHRFRRQGGDIILANMNPALNAIFEVTSMEKYFKIFTTEEAAVEHFQQLAAQHKRRPGPPPAAAEDEAP